MFILPKKKEKIYERNTEFNISERKTPDIEKMAKENLELMEQYTELESKHQKISKFLMVR